MSVNEKPETGMTPERLAEIEARWGEHGAHFAADDILRILGGGSDV